MNAGKTIFPSPTFSSWSILLTTETTTENDAIHLSYGLGWGLFTCPYSRAFFKEGNGGSWRNYNINFIDKAISIIILTNSENGEQIFRELLETLLRDTLYSMAMAGLYTV